MAYNLTYANPTLVHEAEFAIANSSPSVLYGYELGAMRAGEPLLNYIVGLDPSGSSGNGTAQNVANALGILGSTAGFGLAASTGGWGVLGIAAMALGSAIASGISGASSYGDPGTAPTD